MTTSELQTNSASTDWRTRSAAWFPWAVVGVLAATVVGTVIITDNNSAEPPYPSDQLDDPIAPWVFSYVFPVVWASLLALFITRLVRNRRFSMPALLFLAGTTMFWIEWPADWGSYLVYNRDFVAWPGWTSTWYQTYWKPVGVIFGYGVFFAVECIILLKVVPPLSRSVQRMIPALKSTGALIVSCMVVFYTVDILGERLMTVLGWYSYAEPVGPAWTSDRGTISFVWPAIPFLLFAVAITLATRADPDGNYPNEKFFRVHTLKPGLTREFARLAVWITTMNVAIFIAQPLILVVGRILFFHDSVYNP
ncbi:MAG: spirocyclase AveC family protein [Mycobacterium sp.]